MINDILTLIKVISCLYYESVAEDDASHIYDECRTFISSIKIEGRGQIVIGSEEAAIEALQYTCDWLLDRVSQSKPIIADELIRTLKINLQGDNHYIQTALESINPSIGPLDARAKVTAILSELRHSEEHKKLKRSIAKANRTLMFGEDHVDLAAFATELRDQLESVGRSTDGMPTGFVGRVDFSEESSILEVLEKAAESISSEGLLKTGFKGMDRATGVGGIPRGYLVNFGGLTHNYKSGILIDLALNIPAYNDPWMWDADKKPLILRLSFENTPTQDLTVIYSKLYALKNRKKLAVGDMNLQEVAHELKDHFSSRGYEFCIETYDPNNFDVYDLFDVMERYQQAGYEIHAVSCDYLSQIAGNTSGDRLDTKIQKTYEMVRNYCFPKGITFLTACQLSTQAQELARENNATLLRKIYNGGYYMDCKSLHTKLDLEFVMNIHTHMDGVKYLMLHLGKNRAANDVSDKDKYVCYPFQGPRGIVPDGNAEVGNYINGLPSINNLDDLGNW